MVLMSASPRGIISSLQHMEARFYMYSHVHTDKLQHAFTCKRHVPRLKTTYLLLHNEQHF